MGHNKLINEAQTWDTLRFIKAAQTWDIHVLRFINEAQTWDTKFNQ